jgi:hypothetical protein
MVTAALGTMRLEPVETLRRRGPNCWVTVENKCTAR